MLVDSSGRPLRRAIGFFREYRVERDTPAAADIELADAIAARDEIDVDDPFEYDNLELGHE